jgi:hypothetical protein
VCFITVLLCFVLIHFVLFFCNNVDFFNGPLGCLVRTVMKKELRLRVVKNVLFGQGKRKIVQCVREVEYREDRVGKLY